MPIYWANTKIALPLSQLHSRCPPLHQRLAREGIEYSWVCSKNFYCHVSLKKKKGKQNCRSVVVHESMSTDKVLTAKRIRHFSRWARQFICTYFVIWKDLDEQQDDRMDAKVDRTTHEADPISLEELVKWFKTHCCALDFDTAFCEATYVYDLTKRTTEQRSKQEASGKIN